MKFALLLVFCLLPAGLAVFAGPVVLGPSFSVAPPFDHGELLLGELNCTACHAPSEDQENRLSPRPAPILGENGLRLTPQYLRQFLLSPSGSDPGTIMPDMLHHLPQPEKEQVVEALVHFLVSEGPEGEPVFPPAEQHRLRQGRTLYHTIGCVACHEPYLQPNLVPGATPDNPEKEGFPQGLQAPNSVPLGDLARKYTVPELARFLEDPLKTRPGGRMPSLNLTSNEALSIATYLLRAQIPAPSDTARQRRFSGLKFAYYEGTFGGSDDFEKLTPLFSGVAEGFETQAKKRNQFFGFRYHGLLEVERDGRYTFHVTSDDGARLFINGRLVVDNDGDHAPQLRRGSIELAPGEHSILLTYYNNGADGALAVQWEGPDLPRQNIPASALSFLETPMIPLDHGEFRLDHSLAEKGRTHFAAFSCASCHSLGTKPPQPGSTKSLNALSNLSEGCLAEKPEKGLPDFALSQEQRSALHDVLQRRDSLQTALPSATQAAHTMARLNCYACHTRQGKGGPVDDRLNYFRMTVEVDLGDEGRLPPHLTGVGAKLKHSWMEEVLTGKGGVRPYMATRMPNFGKANIGHLPKTFAEADRRPDAVPEPEVTSRDAKLGRMLVGAKEGLSCIACHNFAGRASLGIPALDLTSMAQRLHYDWFSRYLIDPHSLRPGTRMPSFWPGGKAVNKDILEGDTTGQIRAIWAYLSAGREADLPPGLVVGRQELVAEQHPLIYRNFLRDAGARAIGVAYPEQINLAFDANQVRLAMIWQGSFIDAAGHVTGRGGEFVPPLGPGVVKFPPAPFASLASSDAQWPEISGKKGGFEWQGFTLDEHRRPTFHYRFGGVSVQEHFLPAREDLDGHLKRTLKIQADTPPGNLWFRAAVGQIERRGKDYLLDGRVKIRLNAPEAIIREGQGGGQELLVLVRFSNNTALILQEIIW